MNGNRSLRYKIFVLTFCAFALADELYSQLFVEVPGIDEQIQEVIAHAEQIWIASATKIWSTSSGITVSEKKFADDFQGEITALASVGDALFIGTTDGLFVVDRRSSSPRRYDGGRESEVGCPSRKCVVDYITTGSGNDEESVDFWLGTSTGVYRSYREDSSVEGPISAADGTSIRSVESQGLIEGLERSVFWLSTRDALYFDIDGVLTRVASIGNVHKVVSYRDSYFLWVLPGYWDYYLYRYDQSELRGDSPPEASLDSLAASKVIDVALVAGRLRASLSGKPVIWTASGFSLLEELNSVLENKRDGLRSTFSVGEDRWIITKKRILKESWEGVDPQYDLFYQPFGGLRDKDLEVGGVVASQGKIWFWTKTRLLRLYPDLKIWGETNLVKESGKDYFYATSGELKVEKIGYPESIQAIEGVGGELRAFRCLVSVGSNLSRLDIDMSRFVSIQDCEYPLQERPINVQLFFADRAGNMTVDGPYLAAKTKSPGLPWYVRLMGAVFVFVVSSWPLCLLLFLFSCWLARVDRVYFGNMILIFLLKMSFLARFPVFNSTRSPARSYVLKSFVKLYRDWYLSETAGVSGEAVDTRSVSLAGESRRLINKALDSQENYVELSVDESRARAVASAVQLNILKGDIGDGLFIPILGEFSDYDDIDHEQIDTILIQRLGRIFRDPNKRFFGELISLGSRLIFVFTVRSQNADFLKVLRNYSQNRSDKCLLVLVQAAIPVEKQSSEEA